MRKITLIIALCFILIVLTSCGFGQKNGDISETAQSTAKDTPPIIDSSTPLKPDEPETHFFPLYLPLPVYEVFAEPTSPQERLDAFLHHTALYCFNSQPQNLLIPSLRIIEIWEAEDGDTYYLCWSTQMYYPGLVEAIKSGESYNNSYSDMNIRLIRFKIKNTLDWGYFEFTYPEFQCVEILYSADGETTWDPDKFKGFPGSSERIQQIKEGNQEDYIRDVLPDDIARDYHALLQKYLEYYGLMG